MICNTKRRFTTNHAELIIKVKQLGLDIAQHERDIHRVNGKLQSELTKLAGIQMTHDLQQRAVILNLRLVNARSLVNSHNQFIRSPEHRGECEGLHLDFDQLIAGQV